MFTGLIEEIGKVKSIQYGSRSFKLTIKAKKVLEDISIGDSIATNGVCLTVTEYSALDFTVDVMPETFRVTSLSSITTGSSVNLERAMKLNSRFGGHLVTGHIDTTGVISLITKEGNAHVLTITYDKTDTSIIINRGSICIDGVSLTVVETRNNWFKVSIIPHTKEETTLLSKGIGEPVNLEFDMIGKYVKQLLSKDSQKSMVDLLKENGFY